MQENNYCVYKHTSPSGKVYIGITCQEPEKRWKNGCAYKNNQHFANAIKKYGWDNFIHEILVIGLTKDEACQKEIELIAFYKSNQSEFGYNRSIGGEVNKGWHHTEEAKRKIGKASLGKKYCLGRKSPLKGTKLSDEHCKKLSESHKGQKAWNKGLKMSEDFCKKNSEAKKGENHPMYGKHHSEETKRKMSESQKGEKSYWYGKNLSDETKQKMRESNNTPKVAIAYKEYKSNGGTLTWNEFQKEYSKQTN